MLGAGVEGPLIVSWERDPESVCHRGRGHAFLSYTGSSFLGTQNLGHRQEETDAHKRTQLSWKLSSIPYLLPQAMVFLLWHYLAIPVVYAIILLNNSVRSRHTTCLSVNYIQAF